jgi:hypothetical protein
LENFKLPIVDSLGARKENAQQKRKKWEQLNEIIFHAAQTHRANEHSARLGRFWQSLSDDERRFIIEHGSLFTETGNDGTSIDCCVIESPQLVDGHRRRTSPKDGRRFSIDVDN